MKNITISVDDSLALKLRIASAQANKSLSRFLAADFGPGKFDSRQRSHAVGDCDQVHRERRR